MSQRAFLSPDEARFDELRRCLAALLETVPRLCAILGEGRTWTGQAAVSMRYASLEFCRARGIDPPLTAVLIGPSGAGKSTWFRLITGSEVPAGEAIRPVTRGCVITVPPKLCDAAFLAGVFSDYELAPLEDPRQLCQPSAGNRLYYCVAGASDHDDSALILADVPDFNTVECANWKSAEKMLSRAELVVFVVYGEAYSDLRSVEMLAWCCRFAANMIYLFTKTSPTAAIQKRRHLLQILTERLDLGFRTHRADGQTLLEFLAESPFYCSPFTDPAVGPQWGDVVSLDDDGIDLLSRLRSQDARRLVFAGLLEAIREAVASAEELLTEALERNRSLEADLRAMGGLVGDTAAFAARGGFPVGRLMEMAIEEARHRWPPLLRRARSWVGSVARRMSRSLRELSGAFGEFLGMLIAKRPDEDVRCTSREELEMQKLREGVEILIDRLRSRFPEDAVQGGMLSTQRCDAARQHLFACQLPQAGNRWETAVREELAAWCRDKWWPPYAVDLVPAAAGLSALGLVVLDLGVSGGMFGTLGGWTALASGNAAMGWLLRHLGKLELEKVAENAYEGWAAERAAELEQFLHREFADSLTQPWRQTLNALNALPLTQALDACRTIRAWWQAEQPERPE